MQLSGENSRLEYDIIIHKKDDVYSQIECERSITKELNEYFSFDVPGAKFMPSFKNRLWDGKIRLFDIRNNQIYVGLSEYIYKFATAKKYTISGGVRTPLEIDIDTVKSFIDGLKSTVKIRDYQLDAVQHSIRNGRSILVSPTASGKSFIIYILIRYYLESQQILDNSRILLLVPRSSLVEQMYTDFQDTDGTLKITVTESMQEKTRHHQNLSIYPPGSPYINSQRNILKSIRLSSEMKYILLQLNP